MLEYGKLKFQGYFRSVLVKIQNAVKSSSYVIYTDSFGFKCNLNELLHKYIKL